MKTKIVRFQVRNQVHVITVEGSEPIYVNAEDSPLIRVPIKTETEGLEITAHSSVGNAQYSVQNLESFPCAEWLTFFRHTTNHSMEFILIAPHDVEVCQVITYPKLEIKIPNSNADELRRVGKAISNLRQNQTQVIFKKW